MEKESLNVENMSDKERGQALKATRLAAEVTKKLIVWGIVGEDTVVNGGCTVAKIREMLDKNLQKLAP